MTSKTQEALKLALEALRDYRRSDDDRVSVAMDILQEALAEQPALPFGIGGGLVAIKTLLSRDPCAHAKVAIEMIDAMLAEQTAISAGPITPAMMQGPTPEQKAQMVEVMSKLAEQPAQQQKEGFASPGGGYVPAIPRPMPPDWKLVPRKATPEMLKAMDECAQEGYDERLYAGMASSVYMAAWDASPVMGTLPEQPAQQQEPVAWMLEWTFNGEERGYRLYDDERHCIFDAESDGGVCRPLYTAPPASKPLTDEQIWELAANCLDSIAGRMQFARAIEAAHGIKENA